jgi:hypothetical protein
MRALRREVGAMRQELATIKSLLGVMPDLGVPQLAPKEDKGTTRGGGAEVRVPPKAPPKKKSAGAAGVEEDKVPQVVDPPPPGTPSGGAQVRG